MKVMRFILGGIIIGSLLAGCDDKEDTTVTPPPIENDDNGGVAESNADTSDIHDVFSDGVAF